MAKSLIGLSVLLSSCWYWIVIIFAFEGSNDAFSSSEYCIRGHCLYIKIIISKGIGLLDGHRVTDKDTRECVNSLSIRFISKEKELPKTITYE